MKTTLSLLAIMIGTFTATAQKPNYNLLIGTYTQPGVSEGIYVYDFDTKTAGFKANTVEKNTINPSFLTLSPDQHFVYAVNEDGKDSKVSAFSFDAAAGKLSALNTQKAEGTDPCYLIADEVNVIIANYSSGSIAVFGKDASGALLPAKQVIQHTGSSIDTARQKSAHVHMVKFTPDHKYILSNDLGEDKVYIYAYDKDAEENVLVAKDSINVKPGSGPRHITFSPDGKYAYLIQEMQGDLTVFSYHNGSLTKIQETTIVDKNFKGEMGSADIQISADGKFLYASNRGEANDITVFAIQKNGKLVYRSRTSTEGKGPRAFVIDPSGNWLLVGHQYTNNVVIFKRNKATGAITDTGKRIDVGAPVCFVFVPKK
ncbi:lactonase family protein [Pedobacter sp. AW31-3R]|uniref:lactonase family protein n=1 Tax=Pedobacter sp. AW31-3R TaxID=3445781 RepID=UPI003FA154C2